MIENITIGKIQQMDNGKCAFIPEDEISSVYSTSNGFNDHTRYTDDKSYCQFNLSRRAGRAELQAERFAQKNFMRRIAGATGLTTPSNSIVLGFYKGQASVFLCVDRMRDCGAVDLCNGTGLENGQDFIDTMNDLCTMGGCRGYVVFSIDAWEPRKFYDRSVEWFCVPWKLARMLGPIDRRKTKELSEFLFAVDDDTDYDGEEYKFNDDSDDNE